MGQIKIVLGILNRFRKAHLVFPDVPTEKFDELQAINSSEPKNSNASNHTAQTLRSLFCPLT